jgi:peroxiredoxin
MTIDGHDRVASNVMVFRCAAPAGRGAFHRSSLSLTATLALVVLTCATFVRTGDSPELRSLTGGPQPAFSLDDLSHRPVSLGDARGDIVLVHFFATLCEPCRDELPALRRLVERSDPARLTVISISVAEVDLRVRGFIEKTPVNFPVLLDRDRAVAKSWNVSTLPTTFILDRARKPRLFIERDYDWDRFDPALLLDITATGGKP